MRFKGENSAGYFRYSEHTKFSCTPLAARKRILGKENKVKTQFDATGFMTSRPGAQKSPRRVEFGGFSLTFQYFNSQPPKAVPLQAIEKLGFFGINITCNIFVLLIEWKFNKEVIVMSRYVVICDDGLGSRVLATSSRPFERAEQALSYASEIPPSLNPAVYVKVEMPCGWGNCNGVFVVGDAGDWGRCTKCGGT